MPKKKVLLLLPLFGTVLGEFIREAGGEKPVQLLVVVHHGVKLHFFDQQRALRFVVGCSRKNTESLKVCNMDINMRGGEGG